MHFEICDAFALVILNFLTSTYSSRQSAPPLSSYKLFKFLIISPLWKNAATQVSSVEEVIQSFFFFNADWSIPYLNVSARQG